MKYVYVSPALPEEVFEKLLGFGRGSPGQQAQKYNRLLAKGIVSLGRPLVMLSAPPVPPGSRRFKLVKQEPVTSGGVHYRFLKVLDVPVIKNLFTYVQAKKEIKRIKSETNDDLCVVCDLLTLSASLGALTAAKKLGLKSCGIVTDLPGYLSGKPSSSSYQKLYNKAVALCKSFVLLTRQMAGALGVGERPYTVIEGISTPALDEKESEPVYKTSSRYMFYAGGLEKAYGVEKLVKAFIDANVPGTELVICGNGSYREELESLAAENPGVKYIGVVKNSDVMELERRAAVLVNPRTSEGEFTAYSFPSKNIEYMSTGRPLLAYMLPGIPDEYRGCFITPAGESMEALTECIKSVFAEDPGALDELGRKAAAFAATQKSPAAQAAKLTDMIEKGGAQ